MARSEMLISQASRAVAQLEVQGKACKALWVTALFASFIPRDLFSVATTRLWLYGVSFVRVAECALSITYGVRQTCFCCVSCVGSELQSCAGCVDRNMGTVTTMEH